MKSLHISEWPKEFKVDNQLEKVGDYCKEVISEVRKFKTKHKKSLKEPVNLTLDRKYEKEFSALEETLTSIQKEGWSRTADEKLKHFFRFLTNL